MYINNSTQTLHSESDIRSLYPNTSFAVPFNPPALYSWVFPAPQPQYNPVIQQIQAEKPAFTALGKWEERWKIVELFNTQAEKDAAIAADIETKRLASVPEQVTMRQASLALELAGLLDDVEAIVATLPRIYQIEWQRASMVQRSNPLVEMVRQQQSMTETQIDDLFIAAAAL